MMGKTTMTVQRQLALDLGAGRAERDKGMERVAVRHDVFLGVVRKYAADVCAAKGVVTIDDLRRWASEQGIEPAHPNAWGTVFRGSFLGCRWKQVAFRPSTVVSNHARRVAVWALAGPDLGQ